MDTQHETTQLIDDPEQPAPVDRALLFALASILTDATKDSLAAMRAEVQAELTDAYKTRGQKSKAIFLDDAEVATATLSFDNGGMTVTDRAAFDKWVEANLPDEVEYVIRVRPATEKALLKEGGLVHDEGTGTVVHAATGAAVDGVTYRAPGNVKAFSFTTKRVNPRGQGIDGRARLEEALRGRSVADLMGGVQQALTAGKDGDQ